MKTAYVLATYLGKRRGWPFDENGVLYCLQYQIENLSHIDIGVDYDLIIVNHYNGDSFSDKKLKEFSGMKIGNGVVKTIQRPCINQDVGYGSFKYAYYLLQNEYDYWFFSEDDIFMQRDGIVKKSIDYINSDTSVGFVASLWYDTHPYNLNGYYLDYKEAHAHCGMGLTSTKILKEINRIRPEYFLTPNIININKQSLLSKIGGYDDGNGPDSRLGSYEIDFTNDFIKCGFNISYVGNKGDFLKPQEFLDLQGDHPFH